MRKAIVLVALAISSVVHAQNTDEWLRQKRTQLRYLAEQVAALRMYAGYVEKGYGIVRNGLQLVDDIKQGEFSLHKGYLSRLQKAKPAVQQIWKVTAILLSAHRILRLYQQYFVGWSGPNDLLPTEKRYVQQNWNGLLKAVAATSTDVQLATKDGAASFSDAGRLQRIDALYVEMQAHESFAINLYQTTKSLAQSSHAEQAGRNTVKALYGK